MRSLRDRDGAKFYSVQPLRPDGSRDGEPISTDAASPIRAAEKVMGEPLAIHGKVVRATVWVMADACTPTSVTLYIPDRDAA